MRAFGIAVFRAAWCQFMGPMDARIAKLGESRFTQALGSASDASTEQTPSQTLRGNKMANEYTPWAETGETELAYFKRRYLEARAREGKLEEALNEALPLIRFMAKDTDCAPTLERCERALTCSESEKKK